MVVATAIVGALNILATTRIVRREGSRRFARQYAACKSTASD